MRPRSRLFPLSIVLRALTPIFIGIPRGCLCGGERSVCASLPYVSCASLRSVLFLTAGSHQKPQPIEETNQLNTMNFKLLSNLILLYTKALAFLDPSFTLTCSFFLINLAFSLLESMSSAAE